ncbi:MAG: hemolysin III [Myxococcales bacterium]|nr:hemolysin III [Myxococcales bacterium]
MAPHAAHLSGKPRLRGVSHVAAAFVALAAGVHLLLAAPTGIIVPVAVYVCGLVALFTVSGLYHKPMWSLRMRQQLKRLDHATIFVFIAATYTPVCVLALGAEGGKRLLMAVWIGAALGALRAVAWPGAPRAVSAALYVAVGWLAIAGFSALVAALGGTGMALLIAGGVLYTTGAVLYALRWPDLVPGVFGHHEVFHVLVIAAATCHFVMVRGLVVGAA